jgi:hypothetical protein
MNKMMMRQLAIALLLLITLTSCSKEENGDNGDPNQPLVFSSLTAEKSTISPGETTKVTASATGYMIVFKWSASAGDILGSGKSVVYAASPCHAGSNKVTCTVTDGNNVSQSREVFIVVQ